MSRRRPPIPRRRCSWSAICCGYARNTPRWATGDQRLVPAPLGVLAYLRQQGTARFLVAVNTADAAADLPLAHEGLTEVSTDHRRRGGRRDCSLRPGPHEACVVRLDAP
ncbi:hypothetical protein [Streptomyces sp. B5E4]|uniref:hypothetical protein n=1 Tax=Streptomyces sp. B5E4 TaxID=3153568 RepID=UPI00325EDBB7